MTTSDARKKSLDGMTPMTTLTDHNLAAILEELRWFREWMTSRDALTSPDSARPATQTRREPEPVHAPTLTVHGFTAALRALGRDGGEQA